MNIFKNITNQIRFSCFNNIRVIVPSKKVLITDIKIKRWSRFDSEKSYDAFLKDDIKLFLDESFGNTYKHIITIDIENETFIFLNNEDAVFFKLWLS